MPFRSLQSPGGTAGISHNENGEISSEVVR